LLQADLTKSGLRIPKADFVFCCNVAILTDVEANTLMIQNVKRLLSERGHAVMVVPAIESALFASWRLIDWYKKEGVKPSDIDRSELSLFSADRVDMLQGLINIDGKLTKHYSELEISVLFDRCGLRVIALDKIEYDWTSEFNDPPAWLQAPYPWDWLVECSVKSKS
jgi:hypothetical protein